MAHGPGHGWRYRRGLTLACEERNDHQAGELEDPDTLKRRIEQAWKFVPVDQLRLSPQCGFSSTVEGNALSYGQEVAKLELIVKVAQDVWG